MTNLKKLFSAFVAVCTVFGAFAAVTLPAGVTESSFAENTVTDGTTYYATLQSAAERVCGTANATLYCKPGADVGSLQHAPVTATLTIYGNGAYVSGGENRDFDIGNTDPSFGKDVAADMTLTVKDLAGCGAWGTKATEHTVNLVFENCANMGKVWLNGTTGTLNITIKDCAFEGVIKEAVYSNADGAITLTNVDFSNLTKAVNLNHKATGTQTVTIDGCDFVNCGANVAADQIPVRVLSSEGGKSVLTVSGTTFTGTPEGGADIFLPESVGVTEVAISTTAASVSHKGEMIAVKADESYSNLAPAYVAKIGDAKYETLADAFAAAKSGDTVTLLGDCELENSVNFDTPITIDGAGYKVSASRTTGISEPMFNVRTTMTVKNITLDACHKFTYCIEAMGENCDLTVTDVTLLYPGKINDSPIGQLGGGIGVNNGKLKVSGSFTAFSGGESDGSFPFTGILIWDQVANVRFEDGATASIADPTGKTNESDLLLIGAPVMLDAETANLMLSQFNIPGQFVPYTLAVGSWGFTGASPLPWNKIIYYGKEILKVIGENPNEIPAQVGLLQDTKIPEVFIFEDANFSINGNGKKLTGTIDFTDSVGTIENVELTSETKLVMTNVTTGCVKFGDNVTISSPVTIVPPANYGVGSAPLIEFAEGSAVKPEDFVIDQSVELPEGTEFVVDGNKIVLGTPVAKIGEVKYASLSGAIAAAKSGDTVTLLGDCGITTGIILDKNITLDGGNFTLTAVSGDGSLHQMVKIESAATIKDITLAVNHKYDYGIQMDDPASDLTLENVTILYAGKAEGHKNGELLFGASVFLQQGNLLVKGKFTAFSGGETAGTFPFTGILYWPAGDTPPTFRFDTGATASISDPTGATSDSDLLLVGAPGILSV
ncbi:MAG: hypothetical protein J6R18_04325, partial [Kiritimatiellae bacterium]|nr:hypothetical protein [Kiritimatiellia bacterium]